MATIIGKGKTRGVIDLDWTLLDTTSVSPGKALRQHLENNKKQNIVTKFGVVMKYLSETVVGELTDEDSNPRLPSAAAWVALANQAAAGHKVKAPGKKKRGAKEAVSDAPSGSLISERGQPDDWLVILPYDEQENLYWYLVVRSGMPSPGTDSIMSKAAAMSLASQEFSSGSRLHFIHGDDSDFADLAQYAESSRVSTFADIVGGVSPSKVNLAPLAGSPLAALAIIGLALLLVAAFFAWQWWSAKKAADAATEAQAQQQQQQEAKLRKEAADYDKAVETAVLGAFGKGAKQISDAVQGPSPSDVITAWSELVYNTSIDHAGWDVTGFDCTVKERIPSCVVNLKRGTYGLNKVLFEDHPDATLNGDVASYIIKSDALPDRSTPFKEIMRGKDFNREFLSNLQLFQLAQVSYAVGEAKEVEVPVEMPAKPASLAAKAGKAGQSAEGETYSVKMGVSSGQITLNGDLMWQFEGMRRYMESSNLFASKATITASKGSVGGWDATVDYFIRSRAEPLLPAPPNSKGQPTKVELPAEYKATDAEKADFGPEPTDDAVKSTAQEAPAAAKPAPGVAQRSVDAISDALVPGSSQPATEPAPPPSAPAPLPSAPPTTPPPG